MSKINKLLDLVQSFHDNSQKELIRARHNNDKYAFNYCLGSVDSYNNIIRELQKMENL